MKLTFAEGASLDDPSGLFNSSLEGKIRRAIDIREGNEKALKLAVKSGSTNACRMHPDPIIRSFSFFFVESAFLQLTYLRTAAVLGPSRSWEC